jgi:hypothetical protein
MVDLITQGFFHKFVKVFGSLGRLTFIKIRHSTYDGIAIGKEDEGFMVFKYKGNVYRLSLPTETKVVYRFLFCQWVDVDGEKWAISKTDYTPVSSSDPVKQQNFLKRIIMAPQEDDSWKRTIMILLIVIIVAVVGVIIFDVVLLQKLGQLQGAINNIPTRVTPAVI